METKTLKRNIFQRLFGLCATNPPSDGGCWIFEDGKVIVDLQRAPELAEAYGAIRLEEKGLPERVLVFQGGDGQYYAFKNSCTHGNRRLDPIPGTNQVQCCSIGKSIFDYSGKIISGSAERDIQTYSASLEENRLVITL